ncbi:MAG: COX15/CtaA family protein [Bacteroidetes bacterium]|nr:COX15/CtaA family protein [Bacteroidota bacterium]
MDLISRKNKIIAYWLLTGVAMLVIQVLLGGLTRLTGSGLSITEWDPIMGFIPPLNEVQWQQAFDKYQQIAQFKYLNNHFNLSDFKFIFYWEWFHRLWARLMGLVFLIPFLFFLYKKYFAKWMVWPMIILFILGGLQGFIGWLMVESGLNDDDLYVSHFKLAIHFMAAMVLIVYTLIFAWVILIPRQEFIHKKKWLPFSWLIMSLIVVQLVYGSFMAGIHAATAAPTWPSINGYFVPQGFLGSGFFQRILHDPIAIQFVHRSLAYTIFILILLWWWNARKWEAGKWFSVMRVSLLVCVSLQVCLGILTVINGNNIAPGKFGFYEWMAECHQLTGMLLFLCMASNIFLLRGKEKYS